MFERLEEIVLNGEKFLSDAELPEVFLWFPMEKDYVGPALMNETVEQKTDRLLKLAKKIRSQLHRITSGLDATGEERLLEYLELRNVSEELNGLLAECNEGKTENFDKAKRTVTEVNTSLQGLDFEKLVSEILKENHFKIGVDKILIPWLDELQKDAFKNPDKPEHFDKAREIENEAVLFAKEVRKANRMITQLETEAENQENKIFSKGLIDEQKLRFRHIAEAAATKVEQNRAVVLNWGFYLDMKTEADKIYDELLLLYPDLVVKDEAEDLDYSKALPFVLSKFLSSSDSMLNNPPKPDSQQNGISVQEKMKKSQDLTKRGLKVLTKIGECTEKTPSHQAVWDQTCRLKKIITALDTKNEDLDKLLQRWDKMVKSEIIDDLDFQPLLAFMNQYVKCFG